MLFEQVKIPIHLDHLPFATGVPISHELLHAMEKYAILAEGHNFTKQIAAVFAAQEGTFVTRSSSWNPPRSSSVTVASMNTAR